LGDSEVAWSWKSVRNNRRFQGYNGSPRIEGCCYLFGEMKPLHGHQSFTATDKGVTRWRYESGGMKAADGRKSFKPADLSTSIFASLGLVGESNLLGIEKSLGRELFFLIDGFGDFFCCLSYFQYHQCKGIFRLTPMLPNRDF